MKFSEIFDITPTDKDDWFDPVLTIDTKLFIDPFLVFKSSNKYFEGSHSEIINFFNDVYKIIAKTNGNQESTYWKKAESLLFFPEAEELCLGYAGTGVKGSGTGRGFSKIMANAIWEAIENGITEIRHFEEVGILSEGIGADRISDITGTILKKRLSEYTQKICEEHNVPLEDIRFPKGLYDNEYYRWNPLFCKLPKNPYSSVPVLLTPKWFLRELPTISANGFWDYCWSNENEIIRNDLNIEISSNVDKATIVKIAKKYPKLREEYIHKIELQNPRPYDLEEDKKGFVKWYDETLKFCVINPLKISFDSKDKFKSFIDSFLKEFKNFIENNRGWSLLWNDNNTPRSEDAAQRLFLGIVKHYCKANNVDISQESNIGRGPVDFKVSQGYDIRALIELKLAKNTKFWNGLSRQLPKYQEAEGVDIGFFVIILYSEKDYKKIHSLKKEVEEVNSKTRYGIKPFVVDAMRNPPSASKL